MPMWGVTELGPERTIDSRASAKTQFGLIVAVADAMSASRVPLLCVLAAAAPARSLSVGGGPRMSAAAQPLAPEQRAGLVLWPDADSIRRSLPGAGAPVPTGAREAPQGGWWDGATLGGCVVRRFTDEMQGDRWMLWYSARSTGFDSGVVPLATGAVGLAQSSDGVHWERLAGDEAGGACFAPNAEEWWGFDTTHVGVGAPSAPRST